MNSIHPAASANFMMSQNSNKLKELSNAPHKMTKDDELQETAADFESLFINQIFDVMRNSIEESELLENNHGEKIFRSMLDQEFSKIAARNGSLGLGKMVYEQLKPAIES